jgi:colanic acid biosynthesis glycosyl transferase WcaI
MKYVPSRIEFWSSIESHGCQRALMHRLSEEGFVVEERYLVSSDTYRSARSSMKRMWLRVCGYVFYPGMVALAFARWRDDTVYVVSSNTFYAPWIALLASRGRATILHWILDLYPEVLIVAGVVERDGVTARIVGRIMSMTCRRVSANIFLGCGLRDHASRVIGPVPNAWVIPIGADDEVLRSFKVIPSFDKAAGRRIKILYCGNMGYMHDVDTLGAFFSTTNWLPVSFEFRGHGSGFAELRARCQAAPGRNWITFGSNLDDAAWSETLGSSQVALVTMRAQAAGVVMPSKAFSAMLAGQAILAICPSDSDLAEMIVAHDIGWVIKPGDIASLTELLGRLAQNPRLVDQKRLRAHALGWRKFHSAAVAADWRNLVLCISDRHEICAVL